MLTWTDGKLEFAGFGKHNLQSASQTPLPRLQIIKKFNMSLRCLIHHNISYLNGDYIVICSLGLYIYQSTLCQGQRKSVGLIFKDQFQMQFVETVQIKLVLAFYGRVGLQVPLLPRSFLSRVTPAQSIIDLRREYGAVL